MRSLTVDQFKSGLITSIEDTSIPNGAASISNNWLTKLDHIELRRGYQILGTENNGTGKITGVHVGYKANGTKVLFRKNGRKLQYYDTGTSDWVETGTDIFPAAAADEFVTFANYTSLAGNQVFINSPNSSPIKIMTANPGDYADQYDSAKNFKGYIRIKQNRTFLWGRNEDKTGMYGSYIDDFNYTTVTAENLASGNGVLKTFTGTLAYKGGGAKRTCFAVRIYESGGVAESFTDDFSGNLTGSAGGTGTINYMTGAFSVTFNTAPANTANNIKADYQWEDSTNGGVMDFTKSATRLAGEGFVFRQDDGGGNSQNVGSFGDTEFCFHETKTWALTLTSDDTAATNLIFRDRVGIPNLLAMAETGDGVYYVDDSDEADPKFRLLTYQQGSTAVIPLPVSNQLSLSDYRFDKAVAFEYGDYVVWACRYKDSTENDTMFVLNKRFRLFDKLDYYAACLANYDGALVAGDSVTANVYELFSGFDDNGDLIANEWRGNVSDFGIQELKRTRRLWIEGSISRDQSLEVYVSVDSGAFVLVGTQNGTDDNVDATPRTVLGSDSVGQSTLGGETSTTVYHYLKEIKPILGKFRDIQIKFVATGLGYCSVTAYTYYDILLGGQRLPLKYRA